MYMTLRDIWNGISEEMSRLLSFSNREKDTKLLIGINLGDEGIIAAVCIYSHADHQKIPPYLFGDFLTKEMA